MFPAFVAADSTHKLNIENFPFSVLGTVTVHNQFRPIAFHMSNSEETISYTRFFKSVKDAIREIFGFEWTVRYAMADNSSAIQAAFAEVFVGATILNCWFHLVLGMKKKGFQRTLGTTSLHYIMPLTSRLHQLPTPASLRTGREQTPAFSTHLSLHIYKKGMAPG